MITLKTLAQATAQEVFDQVAKHLLAQMQVSKKEDSRNLCAYRGAGGLKCAAGCLIADDEYSESMDIPHSFSWDEMIAEEIAPSTHADLISELQQIHDNHPPDSWKNHLKLFARVRGLAFNY